MKLIPTLLAVGAFACVTNDPDTSSTAGMSWEQFKAQASQVREPGTGAYVIDWDIVVHDDEELYAMWQRYTQNGQLTIYNIAGGEANDIKWNDTQKKQLTYCIGSNFTANQKTALVAAMTAATTNGWGKMADIKFTHVTAEDGAGCTNKNNNVLFDINKAPPNAQYLARAFFPSDLNRSARNVLVADDAFTVQAWPLSNIMGHELGHVLGFRHEHVRINGGGCPETDSQYRAITAYDSASIMHYPHCNGTSSNLAFTQTDFEGVILVYGQAPAPNMAPMADLTSPAEGTEVEKDFTVTSELVDSDLAKGELFIDGTLYQTITTAPYNFTVTALASGPHVLQVKATDSIGQTAQESVNITVKAEQGSGSGSGSGDGDGDGDGGSEGGCNSGTGQVGFLLMLGLAGLIRRRRR